MGRVGFVNTFSAPVVGLRRRNRPAVGCPPYDHQPVLVCRSNFFGSITHRGGRDARVPVRAASRRLSAYANNWGVLVLPMRVPPPLSAVADVIHQESSAVGYPPYAHQRINRLSEL
ncbi:MAG: hypothetical protein LBQ66_06180 [Planctomycetaceae bacterium]|nr:hypothetical protein [Planctomycetaceae bacterium]